MLPRLVIHQDFGQIAVESKPAQLTPRQYRMKMSTEIKPATFESGTKLPRVKIDQTEAFASAGLKPILRMARENYDGALQKGIQAIAQIASESLQFLQIERGGNPVPQIARQNMEAQHQVNLTVKAMPSVGPQIDVENTDFNLKWSPSTLNINWEHVTSDAHFVPSQISVSWLRRPSIEISVEPGAELYIPVNTPVGNYLDAAT